MFKLYSNNRGAEVQILSATTVEEAITETRNHHLPTFEKRFRRLEQKWVDFGWPGENVVAAWNVTPDHGTHQMWIKKAPA